MKTRFPVRILALVAVMALSSCALPPADAWRVIRKDGLFTYWAIELGNKPIPAGLSVSDRYKSSMLTYKREPAPLIPWRTTEPNRYVGPAVPPAARPTVVTPPIVSSQPSVVPTPVPMARKTQPTVATQVPRAIQPGPPVVQSAPSAPAVTERRDLSSSPMPSRSSERAKSSPTPKKKSDVASSKRTTPSNPPEIPSAGASRSEPLTKAPTSATQVPAIVPRPSPEVPFGDAIAGRPGFVNSPFAAKNQIVDVTGLRPGQEVKCPYSGKLFRVPMGNQAAAKPEGQAKDENKQ